jgi:hypothetical protein
MDTPPSIPKKGLGPLAWVGIGCGSIIVLGIVGFLVAGALLGPKIKKFAEDAQKDPARATATTMVNFSAGQIEMVAEDEPGKRYTVREKKTGKLTTIYWDAKTQAPAVIEGDFSAIPANTAPAPESDSPPVPAPAPQ